MIDITIILLLLINLSLTVYVRIMSCEYEKINLEIIDSIFKIIKQNCDSIDYNYQACTDNFKFLEQLAKIVMEGKK